MNESPQKIAKDVKEVVSNWLDALKGAILGDWRAYTQLTFRDMNGRPALPQFNGYEIGKCRSVEGMSDQVREVEVRLRLVPSGSRPIRWISGALRVIREDKAYHASEDGGLGASVPRPG